MILEAISKLIIDFIKKNGDIKKAPSFEGAYRVSYIKQQIMLYVFFQLIQKVFFFL